MQIDACACLNHWKIVVKRNRIIRHWNDSNHFKWYFALKLSSSHSFDLKIFYSTIKCQYLTHIVMKCHPKNAYISKIVSVSCDQFVLLISCSSLIYQLCTFSKYASYVRQVHTLTIVVTYIQSEVKFCWCCKTPIEWVRFHFYTKSTYRSSNHCSQLISKFLSDHIG